MYCAMIETPTHIEHVLIAANTQPAAWQRIDRAVGPGTRVLDVVHLEEVFFDHFDGLALLRQL